MKSIPSPILNNLTHEQFLEEYWQKKPLLIRQAIPNYVCPVDANELAGLAMEEDVESRIVIENHKGKPWQPLNGPFKEEDFNNLPDTKWTLLVQQLDAWSPDINELKQLFDFVPYWRFDDIMASYAPEGGSVGPHYDQYDVFLLQASGKRHWRIGQMCDEHSSRVEGTPLRILKDFEETEGWTLEPGDMLYLPPNIAHYGIGLSKEEGNGDCITLSIGYKAPTHTQVLSSFTDFLMERTNAYDIYEDPDLELQQSAYEIDDASLTKIEGILKRFINDKEAMTKWFGEFSSAPKNDLIQQTCEEEFTTEDLKIELQSAESVHKNEGSRFFYTRQENTIYLFADGTSFQLAEELQQIVKQLCHDTQFTAETVLSYMKHEIISEIIVSLINQGSLYLDTYLDT